MLMWHTEDSLPAIRPRLQDLGPYPLVNRVLEAEDRWEYRMF